MKRLAFILGIVVLLSACKSLDQQLREQALMLARQPPILHLNLRSLDGHVDRSTRKLFLTLNIDLSTFNGKPVCIKPYWFQKYRAYDLTDTLDCQVEWINMSPSPSTPELQSVLLKGTNSYTIILFSDHPFAHHSKLVKLEPGQTEYKLILSLMYFGGFRSNEILVQGIIPVK